MSRKAARHRKGRAGAGMLRPSAADEQQTANRQKIFWLIACLLIFLLGVHNSIVYFGYHPVPNSDFPGFAAVGRSLWSLKLPSDYKRAPVVGLLQVALSSFVGGNHPTLTAGWLLNAILYPFGMVLLCLNARRLLSTAGLLLAILAMINPWVIDMLYQPIAETTLFFFVLLTFFFIFRQSRWAYLFASITTMVRYEGAALILAAFVMDMIYLENKKKRLTAFACSAAASVPLALWMLGTFLSWDRTAGSHYLTELGESGGMGKTFLNYLNMIWVSGFQPLLPVDPGASSRTIQATVFLGKSAVAVGFIYGSVAGFLKRKREIPAMLIFLPLYLLAHILHSFVMPRFCIIINWIVLVVCAYGFMSIWRLFKEHFDSSGLITFVLQLLLILFGLWRLSSFAPYISKMGAYSPPSTSVSYAASAVVILILTTSVFLINRRAIWRYVVIMILMSAVTFSNQAALAGVIGDGKTDIEFKMLAEWYIQNASPGERMVTSMPGLLTIFAPAHRSAFLHTSGIKAENPSDFTEQCIRQGITYVAWDSRLGYIPKDRYYKLWHLENIAPLARPSDCGPYKFIRQIKVNQRRLINIFRVQMPEPEQDNQSK